MIRAGRGAIAFHELVEERLADYRRDASHAKAALEAINRPRDEATKGK